MPNHVHVVMQPIRPLPEIMRWLKAATANRANALLGRTGEAFWRREYYDRWIRSEWELASVIAYVEDNPVRSSLAACPEEWPWSSAHSPGNAGDLVAGALPESGPLR
jgi:REP element-mobilizing transposase RayT